MELQKRITRVVGSRKLLYVIVALFILQSMWVALSYRYPGIYDEIFHYNAIVLFSDNPNFFLHEQPASYDGFGVLGYGSATLFHFILSFVYSLISVFTQNVAVAVIGLRLINILFVAVGLYIFSILLRRLGAKQKYINITLLIYTVLPVTTLVAATINYDNLLFPLTALYFIAFLGVIKSTAKLDVKSVLLTIAVGSVASLVKFTFLPIFFISVVVGLIILYRKKLLHLKKMSFGNARALIIYIVLAAIPVGALAYIYGYNIVNFQSLQPSCTKVMSIDRCQNGPLFNRNELARASMDTRAEMPLAEYLSDWYAGMVKWTVNSGAIISTPGGDEPVMANPVPIIMNLTYTLGVLAVFGIIFSWRSLGRIMSRELKIIVLIAASLVVIIFIQNYTSYLGTRMPYGIQPRYILNVLPILTLVALITIGSQIRRLKRSVKVVGVIAILLVCTQGAGVITHIVLSNDAWYWDNPRVVQANHLAKKMILPIVKGY